MREILEDAKTIIVELIGIIGGFLWAKHTEWDYEPLILLVASSIGLVISLSLFLLKKNNNSSTSGRNDTSSNNLSKEKAAEYISVASIKTVSNNIEVVEDRLKDSKIKTVNQRFSKETPRTIKDKIDSSPLYQKDEIAKFYVGLLVKWELSLFIIHKREFSKIEVVLHFGNSMFPDIELDTNTDDYPIFKTAEGGKIFLVTGKIIKCTETRIRLEMTDLEEI